MWGYLVAGGAGSAQVQKLLALLVESGALYCAIWVRPCPPSLLLISGRVYSSGLTRATRTHMQGVVVAFQTGEYRVGHPAATPVTAGFLTVFNVFMAGGLVPLIVRPPSTAPTSRWYRVANVRARAM